MRRLLLTTAFAALALTWRPLPLLAAQSKVFCMNKQTGQFLYWGHCRPAHAVCNYYGPGGYCRRVVRGLCTGKCGRARPKSRTALD